MPNAERVKKYNCGHCKEDTKASAGTSILCGFCESYFHLKCVDGMTPEFIESCDKMNKLFGGSAFLCVICRKLAGKINKSLQEVELRMTSIEDKLKAAELERDALKEKVGRMESKTDQVKEKVVDMEKEIEAGMEKAVTEMTQDMAKEMNEREERSGNIVVYGIKESEEVDAEERKRQDEAKIKNMITAVGVVTKGADEVKFRAGKKSEENNRPRPMIVKVEDEETREKILDNAPRLAKKDGWTDVFISPDMTWKQREESKKEEAKLRDEALKRTEDAKKEGKKGRFVVVGRRVKRSVMWWEERVMV